MGSFIRTVTNAAGIIAAAWLVAVSAEAAEPGRITVHQDWAIGCDNALMCRALSLSPANAAVEPDMWMSVSRATAHDSRPLVTVWIEPSLNARFGQQADPMYLVLDGRRIAAMPRGAIDPIRLDDGGWIDEALGQLGKGQRLAMHAADGQLLGELSLRGLGAALAEIDRRQGRDGAIGPVPAIKPAPESRKLRRLADQAALEHERSRFGCAERLAEPDPAWTRRLDDSTTLVVVPDPCAPQALNRRSRVLLLDEDGSMLAASFDHPVDPAEPDLLLNPVWDDIGRRLISRWTGRSLGDCGARSSFAWDGARFRLEERREMPVCRGARQFIQTWKVRVEDR